MNPEIEAQPAQPQFIFEESRRRAQTALDSLPEPQAAEVLFDELLARRQEDLRFLSPEQQAARLTGRSEAVLPASELAERFAEAREEGRPLRVKYGIDPTGPEVHLGHAVPLILVDRLQRMGHDVTIIVGDFTTAIGDPAGRSDSRPMLTAEKIEENMSTYLGQISPLLNLDGARFVRNSEWLAGTTLADLLRIGSGINVSQLLQRDDFRKRLGDGHGITTSEILYPLVMGMDSVALKADIEVGGGDQFLNMQMCRQVMKAHGDRPEVLISTGMVLGTKGTGEKMSKSLDNYVALNDSPEEIYGKLMSIPDQMTGEYMKMFTEVEDSELCFVLERMHPMAAKRLLAKTMTAIVHGRQEAEGAADAFTQRYSKRDYSADVAGTVVPGGSVELVPQLAGAKGTSNKELGRILRGGGVKVIDGDNNTVTATSAEHLASLVAADTARYIKVGRTIVSIGRGQSVPST